MSRRRTLRSRSALAAMTTLLLAGMAAACVPFGTRGEGDVKPETRQLPAFTKVESGAGIGVTIRIGPAEPIVVEAQENLLPIITTEVVGGTLRIGSKEGFTSSQPVHVTAVVPSLDGLTLSGGSQATIEGLAAQGLTIELSGGSAVTATGSASDLDLTASGGSRANLENLSTKTVAVDASGGSVANVLASDSVSGSASGGSRVTVFGDATLDVESTGGSAVSHG
jgi:Putative auto-transporter adhesin, head GIN domain